MKTYDPATELLLTEAELLAMQREPGEGAQTVVDYYSKGTELICTKCHKPIATYHRTKSGPHHLTCPSEFTIFERHSHPATTGPISGLDFGEALRHMREGKRVRRNHDKGGWGERRYWFYMAENGALCFYTRGLEAGLASISAEDIRATDWEVLP